jgi:putative ABC transport system permease protein
MADFVPEGMTAAQFHEAENGLSFTDRTGTRTARVGYLRALGVQLADGAWPADPPSASGFDVLVTRQYADRYFADRRAVGASLLSGARVATIVGVVDDIILGSIAAQPQSVVFMEPGQSLAVQRARMPNAQIFNQLFLTSGFVSGINFAVRSDGDPRAIGLDLRSIVRDIDPNFAVDSVIPMEAMVYGVTAQPRFYATLLVAFGAMAGVVALTGIYGVLAYLVGQRTKEIGLRMALGAQRANVLRLVLRRGVTMIVIGITAGVLGAVGLARYLTSMLYGITELDAATYAVVAATFAAVALLASYLPARRATRIDPLAALRHDG